MEALTEEILKANGQENRATACSVFGEWIVLRNGLPENGKSLGIPITRTEEITRALRGALLHHALDPPPAVLSGHKRNGNPIGRPHVAFVAVPDIGSPHPCGTALGVAVVLPRQITVEERTAVLGAIGGWENFGFRLVLGRVGSMKLERIMNFDRQGTLDPAVWMTPSRRWASVTALALDENPGDLSSSNPKTASDAMRRAEEIAARSCERIGLPRPS